MPKLDCLAKERLRDIRQQQRLRQLVETERVEGKYLLRGGKRLISFACNDYFGLSQHPQVVKVAVEATKHYGAGAGASRLVSGNHPLYAELEQALAEAKHTEAALVIGSGYLANIGVISALAGKGDLILADRLVHACMLDGAQISGAKLMRFPHNNTKRCDEILNLNRKKYKHCFILTETVFSMDGDCAPLAELRHLADAHDAWLISDDAHGFGIVPQEEQKQAHIQIGTLSKGLGSYGGYVCASRAVIEYLANTVRPTIFSTALPPAAIAAGLKALELVKNDAGIARAALAIAEYFCSELGLPKPQSAIVPLVLGDEAVALAASAALETYGFFVPAIRPPTIPKGTARLRFSFSALHNRKDVAELVAAIQKEKIYEKHRND